MLVALALALGGLTSAPILLQRADLCEAPVACGYALTVLGLGAVWLALHDEEKRAGWLAAAGLAMGLAVGARPTLLFAGAILLVPILWSSRGLGRGRLLLAALGPATACGVGLMLYNQGRFGNPFDFGQLYQLAVDYQGMPCQHFSLSYLWFNFCGRFSASRCHWSRLFPYVGKWIATPSLPLESRLGGGCLRRADQSSAAPLGFGRSAGVAPSRGGAAPHPARVPARGRVAFCQLRRGAQPVLLERQPVRDGFSAGSRGPGGDWRPEPGARVIPPAALAPGLSRRLGARAGLFPRLRGSGQHRALRRGARPGRPRAPGDGTRRGGGAAIRGSRLGGIRFPGHRQLPRECHAPTEGRAEGDQLLRGRPAAGSRLCGGPF